MPKSGAQRPWYDRPLPLGTIFGVPISLSTSWFGIAIALVMALSFGIRSWLPGTAWDTAFLLALGQALVLMFSVVLHEVAHALMAKAVGWESTGIEVTLWGGHTSFHAEDPRARESFVVSVVGPGTNMVLAGAAYLPVLFGAHVPEGPLGLFIWMTVWANLAIGIFNLLPGMPLDGGRAVEAVVWGITGRQPIGTIAAGWVGRAVAFAGGVAVIYQITQAQDPLTIAMLVVILIMIVPLFTGAGDAIRHGNLRRRLEGMQASALMSPAIRLPADASVAHALDAGVMEGVLVLTFATENGALLRVDPDRIDHLNPSAYAGTPAAHVAVAAADGRVVQAYDDGDALARAALDARSGTVLVADDQGRCLGAVLRESVVQALEGH